MKYVLIKIAYRTSRLKTKWNFPRGFCKTSRRKVTFYSPKSEQLWPVTWGGKKKRTEKVDEVQSLISLAATLFAELQIGRGTRLLINKAINKQQWSPLWKHLLIHISWFLATLCTLGKPTIRNVCPLIQSNIDLSFKPVLGQRNKTRLTKIICMNRQKIEHDSLGKIHYSGLLKPIFKLI